MAKTVYDDQRNVVEKSPNLLGLWIRGHEFYVDQTPSGAFTFECANCDFFEQVPRSVTDGELILMQFAAVGHLRNNPCIQNI